MESGIAPGALDYGPIGAFKALAKLGQKRILVVTAQVEEPFEGVQDERLDAPDRQGAGAFARGGAPMPSATTIKYPSSEANCVFPSPGRLVLQTCIDLESLATKK